MACVQQAQLHRLVRVNVGDDLHADFFERRPTIAEGVFDDPLPERLSYHGPGIHDAECLGHHGPVGIGGLGRDAINHRIRETNVRIDPRGERLVAQASERDEGGAGHRSVALQVVARQHRKWRNARFASSFETGDDIPEHRSGRVAVDVLLDGRIGSVENACLVVDEIATFGDGQADNARYGVGQHLEHAPRIVRSERVPAERADHPRAIPFGAALDDGVQAILWNQRLGHTPVARQETDAVLSPVRGDATLGNVVEIHRLVGAVKPTDPEVNDGWLQVVTRVRRRGHLKRQRLEVGLAKLPRLALSRSESPHPLMLGQLSVLCAGPRPTGATRRGHQLDRPPLRWTVFRPYRAAFLRWCVAGCRDRKAWAGHGCHRC